MAERDAGSRGTVANQGLSRQLLGDIPARRERAMAYDRDEVLNRIDLAEFCDELLGPHKGRGHSASWPCPEPRHGPQTGRTPPVTVFRPRSGIERWHCHGCGAGGTAIDLMMQSEGVDFLEALERLGRRAGVSEDPSWTPRPLRQIPERPSPSQEPVPAMEAYVSACEDWLWGPNGRVMRRYLAGRGLGDDVLRANRVGADPGPKALPRGAGLPRGGPAVVLPLFADEGQVVYLQARYLSSNGRKYDNPSASLVPASPRVGEVRRAGSGRNDERVLVCEGIPDALTAAQAGFRAVAVLGAGLPDERLAQSLVERYATEHLVIAFDADHRGRTGADRLRELLAGADGAQRVTELRIAPDFGDLNGWAQAVGAEGFREGVIAGLRTREGPRPINLERHGTSPQHERAGIAGSVVTPYAGSDYTPAGAEGLDELLETLAYQHLLLKDGSMVTRNVETVAEALAGWRTGRDRDVSPTAEKDDVGLDDLLDRIGYHHVLVDDKGIATENLDRLTQMVERYPGLRSENASRGQTADDLDILLGPISEPRGLDGPDLGL